MLTYSLLRTIFLIDRHISPLFLKINIEQELTSIFQAQTEHRESQMATSADSFQKIIDITLTGSYKCMYKLFTPSALHSVLAEVSPYTQWEKTYAPMKYISKKKSI